MLAEAKKYLYGAYAAIVAVLLAAIYYLTQKNSSLKSKNSRLNGELTVREDLYKLEEAKKEANDAENAYRDTVSESNRDGSDNDPV